MLFGKLANKTVTPKDGRGNHTAKRVFIFTAQWFFHKSLVFSEVFFPLAEIIKYAGYIQLVRAFSDSDIVKVT